MKKESAVAVAVAAAVAVVVGEYIKVTFVTLSVTNRYTLCTPPTYVGGYTGVSSVTTQSPRPARWSVGVV